MTDPRYKFSYQEMCFPMRIFVFLNEGRVSIFLPRPLFWTPGGVGMKPDQPDRRREAFFGDISCNPMPLCGQQKVNAFEDSKTKKVKKNIRLQIYSPEIVKQIMPVLEWNINCFVSGTGISTET